MQTPTVTLESSGARLLRRKTVRALLDNVSETTLWRMEKRGDFPKPVHISARLVGYREHEVLEWLASRRTV